MRMNTPATSGKPPKDLETSRLVPLFSGLNGVVLEHLLAMKQE